MSIKWLYVFNIATYLTLAPICLSYENKMTIKFSTIALAVSASIFTQQTFAETNSSDDSDIEVITIKGDFRESSLSQATSAISLITNNDIALRNAQNLEEIIAIAPNVNFSSGSQRARYYQIRGIGERSQFQEPINPSVGIMVDGVDLTGVGSVASMFDVAQTEIFRGPQGTRFGANALAGLINITTEAPTDYYEGKLKATIGNYGSKGLGLAVSGPANDIVKYRLVAEKYESDGFIDNIHLGRDDTNNRDETSLRAKFAITASDNLDIDLSLMHFDFDNGYDAFSLDLNRNTYSDQPGVDEQKTSAFSSNFTYHGLDTATVNVIASIADSDTEYGYDEDWAFVGISSAEFVTDPQFIGWEYSSTDYYFRDRSNQTLEMRFTSKPGAELFNGSTSWVTGVYYKNEESDLTRIYTFADSDFSSEFETTTTAIYGQLDTKLSEQLTLTTGLRVEERDADYVNSDNFAEDPNDTMVGGKLVLAYQIDDATLVYGSLNRGYKAGGVNTDGTLPDNLRSFDPEYVVNYELGFRTNFLNNNAYLRATAFYMDRRDVQVKISNQLPNSQEFVEYLDNASEGTNTGIEIEAGWVITDSIDVYASFGLLDTEYKSFSYTNSDGDTVSLSGRDQAHAPDYQFNLGINYQLSDDWLLNVSVEGKDEFYFSDSHDQKSEAYELLNASLNYTQDDWNISLWARNITDEDYETRGFYFGNDPRDGYAAKNYTQLGEPAVYGLTVNYQF